MKHELKTLKDLFKELDREIADGSYWMTAFLSLNSCLKAEAVKWVKKLNKLEEREEPFDNGDEDEDEEARDLGEQVGVHHYIRCFGDVYNFSGTIGFIKTFFNITEEDLK